MASQPANSDIMVHRRVRVMSNNVRHTSLKELYGMSDRYVVVPGEEVRILATHDSVVTDQWRYGHPVVRYIRSTKDMQTVFSGVSGLDMPIRLTTDRRDVRIQKDAANVTDDLFQEVADA